ncbi:hypothetical protein YPPY03_1191, partial [Yersinia pestis PY-03]
MTTPRYQEEALKRQNPAAVRRHGRRAAVDANPPPVSAWYAPP